MECEGSQAHTRAARMRLGTNSTKGGIFPAGSLGGSGGTDKTTSAGKTNSRTPSGSAGSEEVGNNFS